MFARCRLTLHTYVCLMRIAFRWPVRPFVYSAVYSFIFIKTTVMRLFFVSFKHSNCLCNLHKHICNLLSWIWWVSFWMNLSFRFCLKDENVNCKQKTIQVICILWWNLMAFIGILFIIKISFNIKSKQTNGNWCRIYFYCHTNII